MPHGQMGLMHRKEVVFYTTVLPSQIWHPHTWVCLWKEEQSRDPESTLLSWSQGVRSRAGSGNVSLGPPLRGRGNVGRASVLLQAEAETWKVRKQRSHPQYVLVVHYPLLIQHPSIHSTNKWGPTKCKTLTHNHKKSPHLHEISYVEKRVKTDKSQITMMFDAAR